MSTRRTFVLTALMLGLLVEAPAFGFPGFARKYSPKTSVFTFMPCSGCHDPFPRLTPFGRRFKEDGFRLPGETQSMAEVLKSFPVALRTAVSTSGIGDGDTTTRGTVKPIAAGSLGSYLSFWVEQPFTVAADRFDRRGINHAWVGVYDLTRGWKPQLLNLRGGRFELDLPFSQAKRHNRFGYDPYSLNGGVSGWSLGSSRQGFEISGRPTHATHYSVTFADRVSRPAGSVSDPDLYLRLAADLAGSHRLGMFLYDGRDEVQRETGSSTIEHQKIGADFDLRFHRQGVNLYGLYLWGRDGEAPLIRSSGGFLQLEKQTTDWLLLTTRYSHVQAEGGLDPSDSLALGAHGWFFERLRLSFEYRFQKGPSPDSGSLIIDFIL